MARIKDGRLKDLQREITCPLCLEFFQDPRMLPCQHIYCKTCLDGIVLQKGRYFACPECRKKVALVGGRVTNLPTAFKVNRMKELLADLGLEDEAHHGVAHHHKEGGKVVTERVCNRHPGQSLDLYCRHCEELVCRDCLLFDQTHSSHSYDKIANGCRKDHVKTQFASLSPIQKEVTTERVCIATCS